VFARHFFIDSPERLKAVMGVIARDLPFSKKKPLEVVVREPLKDKSHDQRKLFHAVCAEAAPHLGLTPNEAKQMIKAEFYGVEKRVVGGRSYEFIQGSEETGKEEYSRLIDFAYQFLAQQEIALQDHRTT
jgi:hypothetical protein